MRKDGLENQSRTRHIEDERDRQYQRVSFIKRLCKKMTECDQGGNVMGVNIAKSYKGKSFRDTIPPEERWHKKEE